MQHSLAQLDPLPNRYLGTILSRVARPFTNPNLVAVRVGEGSGYARQVQEYFAIERIEDSSWKLRMGSVVGSHLQTGPDRLLTNKRTDRRNGPACGVSGFGPVS